MAHVVTLDDTHSIDRLCVLENQLAVFPQKLLFGQCSVLANCQPVFPSDSTFIIPERLFVKFAELLFSYKQTFQQISSGLQPTEVIDQTIQFQNSSSAVNEVQIIYTNNLLNFIIKTTSKIYVFSNIVTLSKAFCFLVLKAYCYSPLTTRIIYQCFNTFQLTDIEHMTEESLLGIISQNQTLSIDYYVLIELLIRHHKLLTVLKKISF